MVVGSFNCTITPTNKTEFLDAVAALMGRTRSLRGCQACRLLADTEDPARFTFILEWSRSRRPAAIPGIGALRGAHGHAVLDAGTAAIRRR